MCVFSGKIVIAINVLQYLLKKSPEKKSSCIFNAAFILARRLPHWRYAADHRWLFQTYISQRPRRFGFHRAAPLSKLNWSQLSAICRSGQSGGVIDLLARRCLPLDDPSAVNGFCAVVQNHDQSGNAASGKLVWNQH